MKTKKEIYGELMKLAYLLEDRLQYDETKAGKKLGKVINKLQKLKIEN